MARRIDTGQLSAAFGGAKLIAGPLIAALGATLLLVSLFLQWYEPGLSAFAHDEAPAAASAAPIRAR